MRCKPPPAAVSISAHEAGVDQDPSSGTCDSILEVDLIQFAFRESPRPAPLFLRAEGSQSRIRFRQELVSPIGKYPPCFERLAACAPLHASLPVHAVAPVEVQVSRALFSDVMPRFGGRCGEVGVV
jgi:hypothetical protein